MHALAVQLAPILGAEKSKVPFYIAGGLLVAWALLLSLVLGTRSTEFPSNQSQQRLVMAVSAVLVLGAISTAVLTSGGSSSQASAERLPRPAQESAGAAPAGAVTATSGAPAPAATQPKATTGTPAPPSSPAASATTLSLAANPAGQLSYDAKTLAAKAGTVTIVMSNASPVEHNVTIAEASKVLGATETFTGGKRVLKLTLKPGSYTFYCSVPGHRQAGMEGTLKVS